MLHSICTQEKKWNNGALTTVKAIIVDVLEQSTKAPWNGVRHWPENLREKSYFPLPLRFVDLARAGEASPQALPRLQARLGWAKVSGASHWPLPPASAPKEEPNSQRCRGTSKVPEQDPRNVPTVQAAACLTKGTRACAASSHSRAGNEPRPGSQ